MKLNERLRVSAGHQSSVHSSHTSLSLRTVFRGLTRVFRRASERLERYFSDPSRYERVRAHALTRWMAQRRTQQLMGLMTGFVQSQVLFLCVKLRILEHLSTHPMDAAALARRLGLQEAALRCVLDSAVSMRLLNKESDHRYALGVLAHPVLAHSGIRAMVEHNQLLYKDLAEPERFLQEGVQGHMAAYWPYAQEEGAEPAMRPQARDQSVAYSGLMDASQNFVVSEVLDSYPFDRHRCVLDIGCGMGRFGGELAQRFPMLRIQLLDLPHVAALAQDRLRAAGLGPQLTFWGRSFLDGPLPQGADLVTLIRVAHDHSDGVVQQLLGLIWQALPVGGKLLLAEPMVLADGGSERSARECDPYFHFYMRAMGRGKLRSLEELTRLLTSAGFFAVRRVRTAMPIHAQMLVATKTSVYPDMTSSGVNKD